MDTEEVLELPEMDILELAYFHKNMVNETDHRKCPVDLKGDISDNILNEYRNPKRTQP